MILYLSGPISGVPDYRARFRHAHITLALGAKQTVLNPAMMPRGLKRYDDYMEIDMAMLKAADGIVMLPGWKKSYGARVELKQAIRHGKKVFFGLAAAMRALAPEAVYPENPARVPENLAVENEVDVQCRWIGSVIRRTGKKSRWK